MERPTPPELGKKLLEWQGDIFDVLKLDEIQDADIEQFRNKLTDSQKMFFDHQKENRRIVLAAIDRLSDEEIKGFYKRYLEIGGDTSDRKIHTGLHDFMDHLLVYFRITERRIDLES